MDIKEVMEMYNMGKSCREIGEYYGVSKSTVQRFIIKNGYVYNSNLKEYIKSDIKSDIEIESNETVNNVSRETNESSNNNFGILSKTFNNEINETANNVSRETIKMVNGSYTISESIAKALKLKAVMENKKVVDIVRESIEKSIEEKYFNM